MVLKGPFLTKQSSWGYFWGSGGSKTSLQMQVRSRGPNPKIGKFPIFRFLIHFLALFLRPKNDVSLGFWPKMSQILVIFGIFQNPRLAINFAKILQIFAILTVLGQAKIAILQFLT